MHERPGFILAPFVTGFSETAAGPVPQIAARLTWRDRFGTIGARTGLFRNNYKITPGLYCVGNPGQDSPILATANYKLSFDALRKELTEIDAWLLVADTRGINVWCAAGKGTFSTAEISYQINHARLAEIVRHREIILPQLGAVGVAALELKKSCGFKGRFGPVLAKDIPRFLDSAQNTDEAMRSITFTLAERAVLVPVEICLLWKPVLIALAVIFLLSGIGPGIYSLNEAWHRGLIAASTTAMAALAGAIATPLLLPWLPGRQFWFKGLQTGLLAGLTAFALFRPEVGAVAATGLVLWATGIASYLAMNFTGSTPFTSLSGVGQEMRRGLPIQIGTVGTALICWLAGAFF